MNLIVPAFDLSLNIFPQQYFMVVSRSIGRSIIRYFLLLGILREAIFQNLIQFKYIEKDNNIPC